MRSRAGSMPALAAGRCDRRKLLRECRAWLFAYVEEDAMAVGKMSPDGARDDVARCEFRPCTPSRKRRPVSSTIVAPSPRTASLMSVIGRSEPVKRGRVELDEFQVGKHCTRTRCERQALSATAQRVGRVVEQAADAASGENDPSRGEEHRACRTVRQHAGDPAVLHGQPARFDALDDRLLSASSARPRQARA